MKGLQTRKLLRDELRIRPRPIWQDLEARLREHLRRADFESVRKMLWEWEEQRRFEGAAWPGNVRELRNTIRSAAAVADGLAIDVGHLPPGLDESARSDSSPSQSASDTGLSLKEIERRAIFDAIERCGGNRTKAARLLEIDRSTLRRKLQEFGVDRKR